MNILCLDPSLTCTGWAIINTADSSIINCGIIRTEKIPKVKVVESDSFRLKAIASSLIDIIKKYNIKRIIAENPNGSKSSTALKALSQVFGLIIGICTSFDIQITFVSAYNAKKKSSVDKKLASKSDIIEVVSKKIPNFNDFLSEKESKYKKEAICDAISVYLSTL